MIRSEIFFRINQILILCQFFPGTKNHYFKASKWLANTFLDFLSDLDTIFAIRWLRPTPKMYTGSIKLIMKQMVNLIGPANLESDFWSRSAPQCKPSISNWTWIKKLGLFPNEMNQWQGQKALMQWRITKNSPRAYRLFKYIAKYIWDFESKAKRLKELLDL